MGEIFHEEVLPLEASIQTKDDFSDDAEEEFTQIVTLTYYAPMRATEYGGSDLATYLADPYLMPEDIFAMAATITDEQVTLLMLLGVAQFEPAAFRDSEAIAEMMETLDDIDSVSVWEDTDRELYDNPIALTMSASMETQLSGSSPTNQVTKGLMIGSAVGFTLAMAGLLTCIIVGSNAATATAAATAAYATAVGLMRGATALVKMASSTVAWVAPAAEAIPALFAGTSTVSTAFGPVQAVFNKGLAGVSSASSKMAAAANAAKISTVVAIVLVVIIVIFVGVMIGTSIYDYYNPHLPEIPYTMFDFAENAFGKAEYVRYQAALAQNGKPGDLNSLDGKTWNALYFTKDSKAGKPITTDMLLYDDNVGYTAQDGYEPVSFFGYTAPANLNLGVRSSSYAPHLYFRRDTNVVLNGYAGSVFSTGAAAGLIGTTLLLGFGIGGVAGFQLRKRKESKLRGSAAWR